ncbi:MAG TPA: tripartite tricarboxylate transporter substrate binding protein [Tissierellaceae bacterium]
MKKKLVSLLLISVLLLTFISGCSNENKPKEEVVDNKNEEVVDVDFPTKKINLIVPWSAGGITDRVARVFAPLFEKYLGQPVTVINKEGASGAIGTEFAYGEDSDGYTVLFSAETPAVFQVMGTSDLSFENFEPIKMLIQDTKVIVVPKDSKYNTFEELIEDIKQNPGKIKMSYSGPGASGHLQGLLFKELGLDVSMTPYGGGNPAMIATISGEVDFTFGNYGTIKDYLEVGDLKGLAVFGTEKMEALPDVPAMTDFIPEAEKYLPLYFPNSILVKEGTPKEIKDVLIEAATKALQDEEWLEFVEAQSYTPLDYMTPQEIEDYWKKYTSITAWLLYSSGFATISPEEFGIERFE